jgi:hypothetical protein
LTVKNVAVVKAITLLELWGGLPGGERVGRRD